MRRVVKTVEQLASEFDIKSDTAAAELRRKADSIEKAAKVIVTLMRRHVNGQKLSVKTHGAKWDAAAKILKEADVYLDSSLSVYLNWSE